MEPSLFLSPAQTVAAYAQAGADKTRRSACSLLLLGALAGALIALAAAASNTAAYGIEDPWTLRTVCALLFPFGLAMVILMGAELFNSAVESVVDLASPGYHKLAADAKDMAAGAVLVCAIFSVAIGLIIFLPKAINWVEALITNR